MRVLEVVVVIYIVMFSCGSLADQVTTQGRCFDINKIE
jgi:hypothetical protein